MADGGGLQGLILRLLLLLLLLGTLWRLFIPTSLVSLQLQAWTSQKTAKRDVLSQKEVKSLQIVKYKHIVQEEAVGQGISNRVQCKDFLLKNNSMEASKQQLLQVRPCLLSRNETISFVTLFVLPEVERVKAKNTLTIQKMEKKKLLNVLRTFLESIQVTMPNTTQVTIISNQNKLKELPQNINWKVTTRQYNRKNLIIQRLETYIDLLKGMIEKQKKSNASSLTHVIFLDFDIIVVDNLGCLFKDFPLFDVALTYRNNKRQPINSGVIIVRGTLNSLSRAKKLLKEVVKIFHSKFKYAFGALGDQLALADIVGTILQTRKAEGVPFEAIVKATRTLFLPCAIYNWTPSEGAGQFHGMPFNVKILHFKGSRKRLMIHAWSLFKKQVSVKDFFNMKCFVLKSGRSKYDY